MKTIGDIRFEDCQQLIEAVDKMSATEIQNELKNLHGSIINLPGYNWAIDSLVYRFILQVILEEKMFPGGWGLGSATETKFLYHSLLYNRPDLNHDFILDLGDWAAVYNKNPYCPMDSRRGLTVRGQLKFECEQTQRIIKGQEDSEKRKSEEKERRAVKHAERIRNNAHAYKQALLKAIKERHSVRSYKNEKIDELAIARLKSKIKELNKKGNLKMKLLTEPSDKLALEGVSGSYACILMAGEESSHLYDKIGYYGEQLVLLIQQLGLNSCWVAPVMHDQSIAKGCEIICCVVFGHGETTGESSRRKSIREVCNITEQDPDWLISGIEAALLAPSYLNEQNFFFEYLYTDNDTVEVLMMPVSPLNDPLQIISFNCAKLHFEIGAGKENFKWLDIPQ